MNRALALVISTSISMSVLTSTTPSSAFVASVTVSCNPLHWAQTCVYVTPDSGGLPDMQLADVERIAGEAIQSWRVRTDAASFLRMDLVPASGPREVGTDGWQVLKFRSTTWCRPSDATTPEICYDAAATALTTVSYVSDPSDPANDGRILDADIELNAVDNYFYDADSNPQPNAGSRKPLDLWNTLSHELGHVQGLDHPCRGRSVNELPSCARDNDGQPLPSCDDVEANAATDSRLAAIYDATMYPSTKANETEKRTPKADDVAGITSAYPASKDPGICATPSGQPNAAGGGETPGTATPKSGCSLAAGPVATGGTTGTWSGARIWLSLSALALFLLEQRRSRSRGPT
jgi:hypothetical protein